MEAIINFTETRLKTMHVIDEIKSHDSSLKRLKQMREERQRRSDGRDPFRKTFLEKIREVLSCGMDGRQHWIRARLRWWSGEDWRKNEIQQEIDKQVKLSSMQTIINDNRGVDYTVEILDPSSLGYDAVHNTDEYLNLLRESGQDISSNFNNLDFSVGDAEALLLPGESSQDGQAKRLSANNIKGSHKKSTTELFLSVQNFVLEKEKSKQTAEQEQANEMNIASDSGKENFAATKLWEQSEEYLPGEKWDPSELSFEPMSVPKLEDTPREAVSISESDEIFGLLVAQNQSSNLAL